jgi:DNA-binding response OmpR family regulator
MHLLVVEDDPRLGRSLRRLLEGDRHLVELVGTGREALEIAVAPGIELLILDIGLPDISGIEVATRLRASGSSLPILMLTARDAVPDRVAGLNAGADDYLVKPFAYEELAARIGALARRTGAPAGKGGTVLANGPIHLDESRREVTVSGRPLSLSPREFSLLECLLRHPGQVLSRDQLLELAWPYGEFLMPNTVDTYVHYLREKLGEAGTLVETIRGVGYRMTQQDSAIGDGTTR